MMRLADGQIWEPRPGVPPLRMPALPRALHPPRYRGKNPPPPRVPPLWMAHDDLRGGFQVSPELEEHEVIVFLMPGRVVPVFRGSYLFFSCDPAASRLGSFRNHFS